MARNAYMEMLAVDEATVETFAEDRRTEWK